MLSRLKDLRPCLRPQPREVALSGGLLYTRTHQGQPGTDVPDRHIRMRSNFEWQRGPGLPGWGVERGKGAFESLLLLCTLIPVSLSPVHHLYPGNMLLPQATILKTHFSASADRMKPANRPSISSPTCSSLQLPCNAPSPFSDPAPSTIIICSSVLAPLLPS